MKFPSKATPKRILSPYITVAVCAVALGLTVILTGIAGQAIHHFTAAISPSPIIESVPEGGSHGQTFLIADAAALPFVATAYATPDIVKDGDALSGTQVVRITSEFHGNGCEYCIKVEYNPYLIGKAGFALTTAKPLDVQEPQRLILWAKGEYGGEHVRFMILGKQNGTATSILDDDLFDNVDFVSKSETVTLTSNWRMYHVDVPAADPEKFNDITHLVGVEIDEGNGNRPLVLYFGGLVYDVNPPDPTFIVEVAEESEENN